MAFQNLDFKCFKDAQHMFYVCSTVSAKILQLLRPKT